MLPRKRVQGGLRGDCRGACRDCRGTAGTLQGELRGHCRVTAGGTAGGLQGDSRGTAGGLREDCRRAAGKLQGDLQENWGGTNAATFFRLKRNSKADCRAHAGDWGLQVGLQRLQGTCRGTAGGLQGDCRDTAGRLQGDSRGTAGQLQGDYKNWEGIPEKRHDQTSEDIRRGLQETAYYMFDCIGDCRGTLQGGLQGDCRKTPRGLQEDVPVNPGGKGAAGTLGPASADLAQHARTSCRGNSEGTPGGLQGALQGVCRKTWGTARRCSWKPWRQGYPRNMWPSLRTGVQGGQGGLQRTPGTAVGLHGGTAGGLQENCRGTARRCSWKLRRQGYRRNTWPDCGLLRLPSQSISEKQKHEN